VTPSYAVDVDSLEPLLDRVSRVVRQAVGRLGPRGGPGLPDDYDRLLREGLAAETPLPQLVPLAVAGDLLDQALLPEIAVAPAPVSLQLLAGHGLLSPAGPNRPDGAWRTRDVDRVRVVLSGSHRHHGGPSLLEAEAVLAGLGVAGLDATALLAVACLQPTWDDGALAHDWPASDVAPWVAAHAADLVHVHERDAERRGFDHERFHALLGTVEALPPEVSTWLLDRALGTHPAERAAAQVLAVADPARTRRTVAALADRSAAVRRAAATWLGDAPVPDDESVVAALEDAVRTEKDDVALGALLGALAAHGRRAADYVDRDALDVAAARAATKPLPAALAWLDLGVLPRVAWGDTGSEVPVETVRSWVQRAVKAKVPDPDALLAAVLDGVDPTGRAALADALLHLWLDAGAPAVARGVLAVVVPGAGERTALLAAGFVRSRAKQQATPAQALVALLARIDHPVAVQALVEAAEQSGSASVRKAAGAEVEALARRRGWTVEQVGDRGAPTAGFDSAGRQVLDYGSRSFVAVLQPDLKVLVVAEDQATRTTLPPARGSDDPGLVAAARATLAAAKKTVTATGRTQTVRLRHAMALQRSWTVEAWRSDIAAHPVLGRLATGIVWSVGDLTFRPLDDGTLSDADDEPVDLGALDGSALVTVAHGELLDDVTADAWRAHLTDYEVPVAFAQLPDPLPPVDPGAMGLSDAVGVRTSAGALHRLAEKAGFARVVGDGGYVVAYHRALPGGVGATLEVRGEAWIGEWAAEVELGPLLLTDRTGPVPVTRLPPVLLAELRRDLLALGG
jgi:hypothetical protein